MEPLLSRPDLGIRRVKPLVGVVSTWILATLRNRQLLPLRELNEAIHEKLYEFNHKPFQKKEGSRADVLKEERPFLLPLPSMPCEMAVWKIATVQYNCHISVEKQNSTSNKRLTCVGDPYAPDQQKFLQWNGERFLR